MAQICPKIIVLILINIRFNHSHPIVPLMVSDHRLMLFISYSQSEVSSTIRFHDGSHPGVLLSTSNEYGPSDLDRVESHLLDHKKLFSPIVSRIVDHESVLWIAPLNLWIQQPVHRAPKVIFNIF